MYSLQQFDDREKSSGGEANSWDEGSKIIYGNEVSV